MIHNKALDTNDLQNLAQMAQECDLVFSQPFFRYGSCNTALLQESLQDRLVLFSSPNFEAYFPDVVHLPAPTKELFPPPLEWHSRCFLEAYKSHIPVEEIEHFYVTHPLFSKKNIALALEQTLQKYAHREQKVRLGTLDYIRTHCRQRPLFHTWRHPNDALLAHMLALCVKELFAKISQEAQQEALALPQGKGFGFNQWPIITRQHTFFTFEERAYFRVAGKKISLEDAAMAYYTYYNFHPEVLEERP